MGRKVSKISRSLVLVCMLALAVTFGGCSGDTGPQGPSGTDATATPLSTAAPESCATCHIDAGSMHQSVYSTARTQGTNATSPLSGTFSNVTVTDSGTTDANGNELYDVNATFTFTDPTVDPTTLDQKRAMWAVYDPATNTFPDAGSLTLTATDSGFTLSGQVTYFFNDGTNAGTVDGDIYCYFAKTPIKGATDGNHVQMYNEVYNAGVKFGTWTYTSPVDVANCEKCHGTPYLKHGYRGAQAVGLDDFVACKNCHYDTRAGSDGDVFFGDANYAYTANIETDVHASHNNEFPYPQSMADCVNCHTYDAATAPNDKFDMTLSDANFTYATCTTCHADVSADNTVVPKPLSAILPAGHLTVSASVVCTTCHSANNGAPTFQQIHPGYDTIKYASLADAVAGSLRYTYSIDSITYDDTASTLTITWSIQDASGNAVTAPLNADPANGPAFLGLPSDRNNESEGIRILVGYYGWGSNNVADYDNIRKDDIIADSTVDASTGEVTTVFPLSDKLTTYKSTKLDVGIIGVPEVQDGSTNHMVAVKSVTKNITLADGTLDVRTSPVDNANCNACHDNIVMHTGDTHGHTTVGNENACVFCHNTSNAANHYEQQSRSIDSYVHAVHVFPTEEFIFPTFTTEDCEACHTAGTYDVPDQTDTIGSVIGGPEGNVTVGPGSRACGSCHRAQDIKAGDTNALDSLNEHTKQFGYRVPTADAPYTDVVNKIEGLLGQ